MIQVKNWSTKKDFQELMLELLNPLKPYYSKNRAALDLGVTATNYDQKAIGMEAFSRPLWALVPFFAGGGSDEWFEECCRRGIAAGTDPENEEYWGETGEYDQRFVEMTAMGYALLMAPEKFWNPLSDREKQNFASYLYKINEHEIPECNWQMFRVLVNLGLRSVGMPYSAEQLEKSMEMTESFYLGEGWYRDGDSCQRDYYVSFAIHYYGLIYAKFMGEEDPERSERLKARSMEFAKQFVYWFDEDGAALPFGRSLTYRFSQVSFFSACLLCQIEPLPVPVMKGLIVRHMKYWLSLPIFDRDDILTIGYGYPNLMISEKYNGLGSAYWSMKFFAFLALPDEHPFWSAESEAYPELPSECAMKFGEMFLKRYPHHNTAYTPGVFSPAGHGHSVEKYGKFAYDTKFAFSIARSCYEVHENCPDSMLAFWINGYVYVRRICEASEIRDHEVWSRWGPYPGIQVETTVIPTETGHIRRHKIISSIACEAYDCGFSVSAALKDNCVKAEENGRSRVENRECYCEVCGKGGEGFVITSDPNTNLVHPKTLLPCVKYRIEEGTQELTTEIFAGIK